MFNAAKNEIIIEVSENFIRIKGNKKIKRFFSRIYGHDKYVISFFKENNISGELTKKQFLNKIKGLKTLVERSSVAFEPISEIPAKVEVLTTSIKARRAYRKVLINNGIIGPMDLLKKDRGVIEVKDRENLSDNFEDCF